MSADPSTPVGRPVIAWPKITATLESATDGTLVINGVMHTCWADNTDALRIGMIARCTATAITLGRPVRVDVSESGRSWALAVRPDGIVQEIDKQGRVVPVEGDLIPIEGRCRRCRQPNPVTASHCMSCGVDEPLGVLAAEPYAVTSPNQLV